MRFQCLWFLAAWIIPKEIIVDVKELKVLRNKASQGLRDEK
jgi:hypothetical protein